MIGQAIKTARKAAGLTQEDLANAIGVKRSVVSKYENGQIGPRYETVERIAEALHCKISDLISSKEEAGMIVDHVIDQLKARQHQRSVEDDDLLDAFDEMDQPGIIAQRYTRFIAAHPQLMQTIKEIGIELEIIDWHRIRIKHDYQETEGRTSELLSDLESLHESYMYSLKKLFKDNYGFDMGEED